MPNSSMFCCPNKHFKCELSDWNVIFKMHSLNYPADLKALLPSAHVPGKTNTEVTTKPRFNTPKLPCQRLSPFCCKNMVQFSPCCRQNHPIKLLYRQEEDLQGDWINTETAILKLKDFRHTQITFSQSISYIYLSSCRPVIASLKYINEA